MRWTLGYELVAGMLLAALAQFIATHVAYWPAWRLSPDVHWTERARKTWPSRLLVSLGPALLLGITVVRAGDHLHGLHGMASVILFPLVVTIGAMFGGLPIARRVAGRPLSLSDGLRDYAISFLIISPAATVFMVMLLLLVPRELGPTTIGIMLGSFILALLLPLGLTLPLVRALGLIWPPTPRLIAVVREASHDVGIEPPEVIMLRWQPANALAFPFARLLAFTPAALELLNDRELRAICLHEIAHLQETTRHKLTRLSSIVVMFPVFTFPVWSKAYGLPGTLIPLAIFFAGNRILQKFSQRMEHAADTAAQVGGEDDAACYAEALEKIYEFNRVPAVMRGKSQTHSHLYDRLLAAGVTPAYPRPQPPSRYLSLLAIAILVGGTAIPLEILRAWQRDAGTADLYDSERIDSSDDNDGQPVPEY